MSTKPKAIPDTYRGFVAKSFAGEAPHLILLAVSDASYPAHVIFVDWISQNTEHFQGQLQRWLATYGANVGQKLQMQ